MTQAPPLYALRILAPGHYALAKFSMPDFNVEATYNLIAKGTGYACDCPASARVIKYKPCKHQRMLPFMMGACNTNRFYEPTSGTWHQPLSTEMAAEIEAERNIPADKEQIAPPNNKADQRGRDDAVTGEAVTLPTASPTALAATNHLLEDMMPPTEPPKIRRRV